MSIETPPRPTSSGSRRKLTASVAAIAIVASGAFGATLIETRSPAFAQAVTSTPAPALAQAPVSFADVVDRVKPAVVAVKVKVEEASSDDSASSQLDNAPPQLREFFRRFGEGGFGDNAFPQHRRSRQSLGSGFFISADGYVVTNNHVIEKGKTVSVTTDDGRTLDAKVVGTDSKTDLALLKVNEGGNFPYVSLAGTAPRVGDWVVAIGNPFGLGGTVTAGIVSARGRDIGAGPYDDFLQIDAPINRGNSGGPTFNLKGEVVGVNTAIASPSGGSIGLAFAIPASTVRTVVDQLKTDGHITRGYLGVQIQAMNKELAEGLGLAERKGALVASVESDTPAGKAGLRSGDVITSVNGEPVADSRELTRRIAGMRPGTRVEIGYLRDGRAQTASVALGTLPNQRSASLEGPRGDQGAGTRLGLRLAPADPGSGAGDEGVAVAGVDPDGPAAAKGIREGDVILAVGGQPVSKPSEVASAIEAARRDGKRAVLMRVKGHDGTRFVAIAISKAG